MSTTDLAQMDFGARIRHLERHIGTGELADRLGVSIRSIRRYRERTSPPSEAVRRLLGQIELEEFAQDA